jgi:signal transduction histidine kinase
MFSLRRRLLAGTAISLTVVFIAAAVALYLLMQASLINEFDRALTAEAQALAALAEQDVDGIDVEVDAGTFPDFGRLQRAHYFEMLSDSGASVARSPAMGDWHFPRPPASSGQPTYEPVVLPNNLQGRAIYLTFQPRIENRGPDASPPQTLTLAVARDTQDMDHALATLRWLLAGVGLTAVVAGVATMGGVVARGLRPLNTLANSIERVGTTNLSERITIDETPREMTPVVERLNELLARLQAAVVRERAFTADVAHELRTPLAGVSSALEVSASRPREASQYQEVIGKCLLATRRMQSMVESLLLLARAEARQLSSTSPPIELDMLLWECWDLHAAEAQRRGLQVDWKRSPDAGGRYTDDTLLRIVLHNLFANAVTHADAGGRIEIASDTPSTPNDAVRFRISNTGSQVPTGEAQFVFERFWRGDAARADTGLHCGLGLALCRKLIEVLGGTIDAESDGGTFLVTVVIPAAISSPGV